MKSLCIAVDFDGTIVKDSYPGIGEFMPYAVVTLKRLKDDGHKLILWTCRSENGSLPVALKLLEDNGIVFDAVNTDIKTRPYKSPKIEADLYVDDRVVGGFPGWQKVYQWIVNM